MKLSYEEKVRIYRSWKRREKSPYQLARESGAVSDQQERLPLRNNKRRQRHKE